MLARTGFAIAPATAKVVRYSTAATRASRRCGTSRVWERQGTYTDDGDDGRALASSLPRGVTGGCGLAPKHHGLCLRSRASPSRSPENLGFFSRRWKSWLARAGSPPASRRARTSEKLVASGFPPPPFLWFG